MLVLLGAVAGGCSSSDSFDPMQQRDRDSSPDAPDTGGHGNDSAGDPDAGATAGDAVAAIDAARAAQAGNDPQAFVLLLEQAQAWCPDPGASNRLAELGVLADRWAAALADGRPKVQAVTERQLAGADWDGLAQDCAGTPV